VGILNNKVIVVTGGTGVIGGAFVEALAKEGAIIGILGRNAAIATERAEKILQSDGLAIPLIADVLNESQLLAARDKLIDAYGKIDGLVNAAGGNLPKAIVQSNEDVFDLNIEALESVMKLNVVGTILPTQIFGKSIFDTATIGSIVNISSVAAQHPLTKVLGYSIAKTAIEGYTKWFAVELANRYGDAIRMNAIAPGFFLTEQNKTLLKNEDGSFTQRAQNIIQQTPFKRFGNPNELAGALIWLLSNESKFVTGTTITIDGGFTSFAGV